MDKDKDIYRPTGPDGRGWGEYRILSPEDINYFEEMRRIEEEKLNKQQRILQADRSNLILDEDERVKFIF